MTTVAAAGLIGTDLLMRSRLSAALGGRPLSTFTAVDAPVSDPPAVLYVDLNADADSRVAAVGAWHATHPELAIVGFCGHEEMEVRRQAMAAGATRVVTNGGLAADVRRHLTGAAP